MPNEPPKTRKKTRHQYKLNWAQILAKLEKARSQIRYGELGAGRSLDEAIEAMKERMYSTTREKHEHPPPSTA